MTIYIDMDGVLVKQTGRDRFDRMPWTRDGKQFWTMMEKYRPHLISTANAGRELKTYEEKRIWIDREIGPHVRLFLMADEVGKAIYSSPGHVLIDNDAKQKGAWESRGGFFVHYKSATQAISDMHVMGLLP